MEKTMTKRPVGGRWLQLAVGCLLLLLLGLIYAWSVFIAPLEAEFGWNRAQTSMTFTLSIILFCAGGIAGGLLARRTSPRVVLVAAALFVSGGFLLAGRVTSLAGIYLAYGVCVGLGVGLAYNAIISAVTSWFADKKGLASGLLLMGFGAGGMLLGSVATGLMAAIGWRTMFLVFAAVFAAPLLLGALLLRACPPPATAATAQKEDANDLPTGQVLRQRSFWVYFVWSLVLVAAGLVIIGHAAAVVLDMGLDAGLAALVAGLVSVANGGGRVLFGLLYDKLQLRRTMGLITLCAALAPLCLILAVSTRQVALLAVGFVLTGAFYGGVPTVNAAFARGYYGARYFSSNFSMVNSSLLFAPLIGSYLAGALRTQYGSYLSSFVVMLVLGVLGIAAAAAMAAMDAARAKKA